MYCKTGTYFIKQKEEDKAKIIEKYKVGDM